MTRYRRRPTLSYAPLFPVFLQRTGLSVCLQKCHHCNQDYPNHGGQNNLFMHKLIPSYLPALLKSPQQESMEAEQKQIMCRILGLVINRNLLNFLERILCGWNFDGKFLTNDQEMIRRLGICQNDAPGAFTIGFRNPYSAFGIVSGAESTYQNYSCNQETDRLAKDAQSA